MKSDILSLAGLLAVNVALASDLPEAPAVPAASVAYVPGKPYSSDRLRRPLASYENVTVSLELNNDKDRLGARLLACSHPLGYDTNECEEAFFTFPSIVVDKATKTASADGQRVVEHLHPAKPWKLKYKATPKVEDTGFDRVTYDQIEVWLERSN